jgi:hypothetical protein
MLRCNLEEREDAAMAQFVAGLNHEIQDILEYKDYANITHLFHFACKAKREVQGRHASAKTNFSAGRTNSWQRNNGRTTPSLSPSQVAPSTSSNSSKPRTAITNSATWVPSATKSTPPPVESATSSSRARDIQCHRCKGFRHVNKNSSGLIFR